MTDDGGPGIRWSVALCTYNGARYLDEQLASILRQTEQPAEVVIVDDASTDGTPDLILEFQRRAPFDVRTYLASSNVGSILAFERAVSMTRGDYVALCDQDDVWFPQKLQVMGRIFDAHTEVGLVFSDAVIVDEGGRETGGTAWQTEQVNFAGAARSGFDGDNAFDTLLRENYVTGAACAFRGAFRELILPFSVLVTDDVDSWRIHDGWVALLIASLAGVVAVDEPLSAYRVHAEQQIGLVESFEVRGLRRLAEQLVTRGRVLQARRRGLALVEKRLSAKAPPVAIERVLDELDHLDVRLGLPRSLPARLRIVRQEVRRGGYGRYSNGASGVLRDLLRPIAPREL